MIGFLTQKQTIAQLLQQPQRFFADTNPRLSLEQLKQSYLAALFISCVTGGLLSWTIEVGFYFLLSHVIIQLILTAYVIATTRIWECGFSTKTFQDVFRILMINFTMMTLTSAVGTILSLSWVGVLMMVPLFCLNIFWFYMNLHYGLKMSANHAFSAMLTPIIVVAFCGAFLISRFIGP